MGAFGGGLAGTGEVCGAVVGGIAVFGLIFSRGNVKEKEDPRMWSQSKTFLDRFRKEISEGKLLCREIAHVDWDDDAQVANYYRKGSERQLDCRRLVGNTARLLGEMIEEEMIAGRK